MSEVALLLSGLAFAVSLVCLALVLRRPAQAEEATPLYEGGEPVPIIAGEGLAWYGNSEDGYARGPFTVKRMPARGADVLRGNEAEWVAYRDGERAYASPDLEDVLRVCETVEDD